MFIRNGQKLGSLLVNKQASSEPELEKTDFSKPQIMEPPVEKRSDGVHAVGGGWYEVVIDGEVIDKIRGAEAAQSAYDAYLQSEPDELAETTSPEVKEGDSDDDDVSA